MAERRRVLMFVVLGVMALVLVALPQIFLLLPNPSPTAVADLEAAGRGVYVVDGATTWRLFPRATPLQEVPVDAPEVSTAAVIVTVARGRVEPQEVYVRSLGDDPVAFEAERSGERMRLTPSSLAEGDYEVSVPRDSMFGGTDYYYFSVL